MFRFTWLAFLLLALRAGGAFAGDADAGRKAVAERFLRGVYGADPAVVDELASDDIAISYPIFKKLFGSPEIRGREAVRAFAVRFGTRWVDARITIRDAIEEGDRVVLLWSFRARNAAARGDDAPAQQELEWGGMTLYRFDASGKIVSETGYEGEPGPVEGESTPDSQKSP